MPASIRSATRRALSSLVPNTLAPRSIDSLAYIQYSDHLSAAIQGENISPMPVTGPQPSGHHRHGPVFAVVAPQAVTLHARNVFPAAVVSINIGDGRVRVEVTGAQDLPQSRPPASGHTGLATDGVRRLLVDR